MVGTPPLNRTLYHTLGSMRHFHFLLLTLVTTLITQTPALAFPFKVDKSKSHISFSGTHAGKLFTGEFADWTTKITFSPDDLGSSHIKTDISVRSATTGNRMYDGTLPQSDWFDVTNYPEAHFESTALQATEDDHIFMMEGNLTIRNITKPVSFPFTLTENENETITATATLPIRRLDFDIGKKSDPDAEWVGKEITITLDITARPEFSAPSP